MHQHLEFKDVTQILLVALRLFSNDLVSAQKQLCEVKTPFSSKLLRCFVQKMLYITAGVIILSCKLGRTI